MERCITALSFIDRFYARFLLSNAEVTARFQNVDLKRQAGVLRASPTRRERMRRSRQATCRACSSLPSRIARSSSIDAITKPSRVVSSRPDFCHAEQQRITVSTRAPT